MSSNLLPIAEIAKVNHLSNSYLYKLTSRREISFNKIGKKIFIDSEYFSKWLMEKTKVEAIQ